MGVTHKDVGRKGQMSEEELSESVYKLLYKFADDHNITKGSVLHGELPCGCEVTLKVEDIGCFMGDEDAIEVAFFGEAIPSEDGKMPHSEDGQTMMGFTWITDIDVITN